MYSFGKEEEFPAPLHYSYLRLDLKKHPSAKNPSNAQIKRPKPIFTPCIHALRLLGATGFRVGTVVTV
jgi:hypothetical protein